MHKGLDKSRRGRKTRDRLYVVPKVNYVLCRFRFFVVPDRFCGVPKGHGGFALQARFGPGPVGTLSGFRRFCRFCRVPKVTRVFALQARSAYLKVGVANRCGRWNLKPDRGFALQARFGTGLDSVGTLSGGLLTMLSCSGSHAWFGFTGARSATARVYSVNVLRCLRYVVRVGT